MLISFCDNMIVISSEIVQVILSCNSYNLITFEEEPGSISKRRTLIYMYATLWVDVVQTVSTIDEFETMIDIDLTIEQGSESTLFVSGEQTLSTIDGFGNMIGGIVTIEDTSGPKK